MLAAPRTNDLVLVFVLCVTLCCAHVHDTCHESCTLCMHGHVLVHRMQRACRVVVRVSGKCGVAYITRVSTTGFRSPSPYRPFSIMHILYALFPRLYNYRNSRARLRRKAQKKTARPTFRKNVERYCNTILGGLETGPETFVITPRAKVVIYWTKRP